MRQWARSSSKDKIPFGVQIDSALDWKEQIKAVSTKVSSAIGFLRHARSFLPMASFETLYTGIVEPHFPYRCSVWGHKTPDFIKMYNDEFSL